MELNPDELKEVMTVFKVESDELLKTLQTNAGRLKGDSSNPDVIEILDRTAHSLKGAARMLGISPIEEIGEQLEFIFKDVMKGKRDISPDLLGAIGASLDVLEKLVEKMAADGSTSGIDVQEVVGRLKALSEG